MANRRTVLVSGGLRYTERENRKVDFFSSNALGNMNILNMHSLRVAVMLMDPSWGTVPSSSRKNAI